MAISTTPEVPLVQYKVDFKSIKIQENEINGIFIPNADVSVDTIAATELEWSMKFYQNGILRVQI